MRKWLFIILFLSLTAAAHADWPIEPYQGNLFFSLEDERRDFPVAAFCDSVGGVSVIISSEAPNQGSHLYIQGIDVHGNLRWPENPNGHVVAPHTYLRDHFHAVPGPDSTTFVGWSNVIYDNTWDTFSYELILQRVGSDGQWQWNDGLGIVLSEFHNPYGEYKEIISIHPLPDGSVYVLWYDRDVYDFDGELIYEGNYHIQRFAPDGTEMWQHGGLEPLPDSLYSEQYRPGVSQGAVLMDSNQIAFLLENSIIRIRPDGSYVWAREELVLDSLSVGTKTKFIYRDTADTLVVVGAKRTDEYVCYMISPDGDIELYSEFDYNTFNTIDQAELNKYPSNDFSLTINRTLIMLNDQLQPIYPEIGRNMIDGYFYKFDVNQTGIGISGDYGDDRRLVFRFDTDGNELWTNNVYDDTSGVGRVMHALDDNGNMFVFWLKDLGDNRWLDCYTNIFSPEGIWGQPLSVPDDGRWNPALPAQFTVSTYPNPFNSVLTLTVQSEIPSPYSIEIYDILGRLVYRINNPNRSITTSRHIWRAESLSSGTYFIQVQDKQGNRVNQCVTLLK